jgi:phosphatidylglycerophosphate synthase
MLSKEQLRTGFSQVLGWFYIGARGLSGTMRLVFAKIVEVPLERVRWLLRRHSPMISTSVRLILGLISADAFGNKKYVKALAFLLSAAILDGLDGHLGRRPSRVSRFGAFLDAACDLVILAALFIKMSELHTLTNSAFVLCMLAVSLIVLAHVASYFRNFDSAVSKENWGWLVKQSGAISIVFAYAVGVLGVLYERFPGLLPHYLKPDRPTILLLVSIYALYFASIHLISTFRVPSRDSPQFRIYRPCWLHRRILERFRLEPMEVLVWFQVFPTTLLFLIALQCGTFFDPPELGGIRATLSEFWAYGLILPLIVYFAADFYRSAPKAIDGILKNCVIYSKTVGQVFKEASMFSDKRAYLWLLIAVTAAQEFKFRHDMWHSGIHWILRGGQINWAEIFEVIVHLVSVYVVLFVLVYGTATLVYITRLVRKIDFRALVFHQDRYTGIKEVVHLLTVFTNIVLLASVEFILTIIDARTIVHARMIANPRATQLPVMMHLVVFAFGLLALPILSFVPIGEVHKGLVKARRGWMEQLNIWFQAALGGGVSGPGTPAVMAALPAELRNFGKADGIKRAIDRIPMWPLPVYEVGAFLAKVVIALVAFAASVQEIHQGPDWLSFQALKMWVQKLP